MNGLILCKGFMTRNMERTNRNELVSIITPTYNCEAFIKKTIMSVLSQTYEKFELIIVDDCSKDRTVEIINSFSDERIILLKNEKNMGAAYSRNVAIEKARGDYLAFLDGDDLWETTKLEKQIEFMKKNNFDFSYTNYDLIDEDDKEIGIYYTGPKTLTFRSFLRTNYVGCLTVIYKKTICPNVHVPDDLFKRNDYAMWLLISKNANCYLFNEILSHYRITKDGISSGKKTRIIKHHVQLFKEVLKYNILHAYLCAIRNILFYFIKQLKYRRKSIRL